MFPPNFSLDFLEGVYLHSDTFWCVACILIGKLRIVINLEEIRFLLSPLSRASMEGQPN